MRLPCQAHEHALSGLREACEKRSVEGLAVPTHSVSATIAKDFFAACETGKGWEGCTTDCTPAVTSTAQAEPLLDIKTLAQYAD